MAVDSRKVLEASLSRDELIALKNNRLGVLIFQVSWIMVFICLIVVNLQIRSNFTEWPPEGVAGLDRILPTIATFALLVSSETGRRALLAIRRDDRAGFLQLWAFTLALGIGFAAIMLYQWAIVPISGQYSTIFRVMVGYHFVHAVVIGGLMATAWQGARKGQYNAVRHWAIEGSLNLWGFVIIAWVLFYLVLYVV